MPKVPECDRDRFSIKTTLNITIEGVASGDDASESLDRLKGDRALVKLNKPDFHRYAKIILTLAEIA